MVEILINKDHCLLLCIIIFHVFHLATSLNIIHTFKISLYNEKDEKTNNNQRNTTLKLKIEQHGPHQKTGGSNQVLQKGKHFLLHMWHPPCCSNPVISHIRECCKWGKGRVY